jgi:hypothetical protein
VPAVQTVQAVQAVEVAVGRTAAVAVEALYSLTNSAARVAISARGTTLNKQLNNYNSPCSVLLQHI